MSKILFHFLVRWVVCGFGLLIAAHLLGHYITFASTLTIVFAGLILAAINTIIKPILVVISFPALLLSVGLFMIVINGITVYLASHLYPKLHITNFWAAIFAGMVIGLLNYIVTKVVG